MSQNPKQDKKGDKEIVFRVSGSQYRYIKYFAEMKGKTVHSYFKGLAMIAAGDGKEFYNGVHADKDIFCGMDKALEMREDDIDFLAEGIPASGCEPF